MSKHTRFLLVAPARSGSTVLRTTLNGHPEIVCHGEVLGRNRILGLVRGPETPGGEALYKMREESVCGFLESQIFSPRPGVSASGFKALYYHFGELQFAEAIDELASSVDMKVVFLWRTDLVKRALSEIQHRMTAASKEAPVAPEVARIAQDCRNQLTCFSWLQALFSGHSCIKFSYEELVSDQKAVLNEICGFLGVEKDRIMLPEKPRGSGVTETAPSRGIVQRLRDLAGVKGLPSEPGRSPYPLVSNAASLLKADALREYRDVLPWKQG